MIELEKNFDLKFSLFSGQCFRMSEDNEYYIIIDDRVLKIKETEEKYLIFSNKENNLKEKVIDYFDLKTNYDEINQMLLKNDNDLKDILVSNKGYKIFKQNKLEMFLSYIISQNNNVKRISKSINKICELYGEKIIFENKEYYLFPKLDRIILLTKNDLKECKLGFRDEYIMEAIKVLKEQNNYLEKLEKMTTEEAMSELMKIKGIGPKVASCILLFGYHRFDSYPIDTWAKKYFFNKYSTNSVEYLQKTLKNKYKNYSGLVIQYVFNYERNVIDI